MTRYPCLLLLLPVLACAESLPPHPRLLFNSEGIARLKSRTGQPQWRSFLASVDSALAHQVDLPARAANWPHWYVCPQHGARLTTGRQLGPAEWEHICPVGKEVLRGDPTRPDRDFDGCVINSVHDRYAREAQRAGIAYQVTGDAKYAARTREILLGYAERYLSYPLHTTRGQAQIGGGRVTSQSLDESVWLIPLAQGADLIWDTLSGADRKTLADKLFLPAARDTILAHRMGIHNIQNWKNSAVGLTGFLLGDDTLIRAAIDDPARGYREQMARGVQSDGAWFEGAWGYHFYTLSAVWPLTEAARNCGIDLYGEPLKKMFQAPIRFAMPNGMLPAFNDSTETSARSDLYELAWARYHDPMFAAGLAGSNRRNDFALWFGDDQPPPAGGGASGSRNSPASGYAILQRGEGAQATWLCLKYGPHGGGHGHPDKNNFILYAGGKVLFPDPGTRPYGSPLHGEWDRVTLAHNTLVVDSASQAEATGKSLAFGDNFAMTDAGNIYPGIRFIRTAVMLSENLILFVDRITADKPHRFDLASHMIGTWKGLPAGEGATLKDTVDYKLLGEAARWAAPNGIVLSIDHGPSIVLAGGEPTDVVIATGPGRSTEDRVPMAIFSRTGEKAEFVWAISIDGSPVKLSAKNGAVHVEADRVWNVVVDTEKGLVEQAGRPAPLI